MLSVDTSTLGISLLELPACLDNYHHALKKMEATMIKAVVCIGPESSRNRLVERFLHSFLGSHRESGPSGFSLQGSIEERYFTPPIPPTSFPIFSSSRLVSWWLPCYFAHPGEHAYKCSSCSFSTMTISQLKEHSLKVHGKALALPRPRIVSLVTSHAQHASKNHTTAEEVEDSNGKRHFRRKDIERTIKNDLFFN